MDPKNLNSSQGGEIFANNYANYKPQNSQPIQTSPGAPSPTPTPTPNTGSVSSTGEQLDPSVVTLAKAIRSVESTDNYNAHGKSGEFGAYQFMPDTWKIKAKQFLGDENAPMTPINQDKVVYYSIKELKDQGYSPEEIASTWNS